VKSPAAPSAPAARSGLSAIGSAWWWLAAGLYALAIFLLAGQSYPLGIKHMPFLVDKVIHVLVYGAFSVVLFAALRHSRPRTPSLVLASVAAVIAVLYGLSDEYHQSFIPFRRTDAYDLAANAVGAVVAQGLVLWSGRGQ
jgi:VanZ family protein